MQLKIVLTNGVRQRGLFWLAHNGSDVYCGPIGHELKWSYHASGAYHVKDNGERLHLQQRAPLKDVVGYSHITGFAIGDIGTVLQPSSYWEEPTGKKVDAIVTVDGRTLAPEATLYLTVGVLAPGALNEVKSVLAPVQWPNGPYTLRSIQITATVSPWIVVAIHTEP